MNTPVARSEPFTMIRRRPLWASDRFRTLSDDDTRYLFLYLLTSPHQTSTGCFVLKQGYALADLELNGSTWTPEKYQGCRQALMGAGLIMADDQTDEILIMRWWKDCGPTNESWYKGAAKQCAAIVSPELRSTALEALEECWARVQACRSPHLSNSAGGVSTREKLGALANKIRPAA